MKSLLSTQERCAAPQPKTPSMSLAVPKTDSEMTGTIKGMEMLFLLCSGEEVKLEFCFLSQCFIIILIMSYENKEIKYKNVKSRGCFVLS